MSDNAIGAEILSIITESLYDNPIVIFREYVQNSVDSIAKSKHLNKNKLAVKIYYDKSKEEMCFLDNGTGVEVNKFEGAMRSIAYSQKDRIREIGYKGIGRLSGLPYCEELIFINVLNYKNKEMQGFSINYQKYIDLKKENNYTSIRFEDAMDRIGGLLDSNAVVAYMQDLCGNYAEFLKETNTGFIVILRKINRVLVSVLDNQNFEKKLQWLLPVDFDEEFKKTKETLVEALKYEDNETVPAVKAYNIYYQGNKITRTIDKEGQRDYFCQTDFAGYGRAIYSFSRSKIAINSKTDFTGIKVYIDNVLLCEEEELVDQLQKYGLLDRSVNEMIQSVKGVGVLLYITDKLDIIANARRTFFEVTSQDAFAFLRLLAEFIEKIIKARYDLSKYNSALKKENEHAETVTKLRENALISLQNLAQERVELSFKEEDYAKTVEDKKRYYKKAILNTINERLKIFIAQKGEEDFINVDTAVNDFLMWCTTYKKEE